jgi:hypothetical protein
MDDAVGQAEQVADFENALPTVISPSRDARRSVSVTRRLAALGEHHSRVRDERRPCRRWLGC